MERLEFSTHSVALVQSTYNSYDQDSARFDYLLIFYCSWT